MRVIRYGLPVLAACLVVGSSAAAQPRPKSGAEFPAARFDSLDRIAFYLWQYDSFAWATSDKLNAEASTLGKAITDRLGSEWFCFQQDSVWHAVYGRYDPKTDKYDAAVHYVSAAGRKTGGYCMAPNSSTRWTAKAGLYAIQSFAWGTLRVLGPIRRRQFSLFTLMRREFPQSPSSCSFISTRSTSRTFE
jgi:hypothetical protein